MKVLIPGGAGLVGLNLLAKLQEKHPSWELVVIDKKRKAVEIGRSMFPNVYFICHDLCHLNKNLWDDVLYDCDICVMLQAEIGNTDINSFKKNNIESTEIIVGKLTKYKVPRLIHISSSVVNSVAEDIYTKSKREQESIVKRNWPNAIILRPTLMFGWFDRKHMGWLARFMKKSPLFPIPGSGNFIRQPLYVGDFCNIVIRCIEDKTIKGTFEITGLERVSYLHLMKTLKRAVGSKTMFIHIPKLIFGYLLVFWGLISKSPAFTYPQLQALTAGDEFIVYDWPNRFRIVPTRLEDAISISYKHPKYSKVFIPFN